jgi:hypothetical protein
MRIGLKIIGVALALCGVFFLSVFPFPLGYAIRTSDNDAIVATCILAVIGVGFLFAGRYYLRLNPDTQDAPRPASKLSLFLADHRRNLKVLAQAGFVLSAIRLVVACFGSDWPVRWTTWVLLIGAFTLRYCGEKAADPAVLDNRDWGKVPRTMRGLLNAAGQVVGILVLCMAILATFAQWSHSLTEASHFVSRIALNAMVAFVYAHCALFFKHGELRGTEAAVEPL